MTLRQRLAAFVAVLAILAVSTVGARWVVCTGADGHVAIESLAAQCCGDAAIQRHAPEQPSPDRDAPDGDRQDGGDGCGDCVDVLLAQSSPVRDAQPEVPDVGAPAALAALARNVSPVAVPCARETAFARAPLRPPPLTRHLATTVLRL